VIVNFKNENGGRKKLVSHELKRLFALSSARRANDVIIGPAGTCDANVQYMQINALRFRGVRLLVW
jgi:hypothetical protein